MSGIEIYNKFSFHQVSHMSRAMLRGEAKTKKGKAKPPSTEKRDRISAENIAHAKMIRQRRQAENEKKWAKFYAFVRSDKFRSWYLRLTGEAWLTELEAYPDEAYKHVESLLHYTGEACQRAEIRDERYRKMGQDPSLPAHGRRRLRQVQATPPWVDWGEIKKMEETRDEYNELYPDEAPFHVDHVIPLQGATVCGLHVHTNMQVITRRENVKKSNKFCG